MRRDPKPADLKLRGRLLIGALAGIAGTFVMTAAMSRLHRRLPEAERYPLTPREIVDSVAGKADASLSDEAALDLTTAGHFAYGAACGSLIAAANPRIGSFTGALARNARGARAATASGKSQGIFAGLRSYFVRIRGM